MLSENPENLDDLIREEKHRVAVEFFQDAWANAEREGIEAPIAARSALTAILTELCRVSGPGAVDSVIDELAEQAQAGQFMPERVLQ